MSSGATSFEKQSYGRGKGSKLYLFLPIHKLTIQLYVKKIIQQHTKVYSSNTTNVNRIFMVLCGQEEKAHDIIGS